MDESSKRDFERQVFLWHHPGATRARIQWAIALVVCLVFVGLLGAQFSAHPDWVLRVFEPLPVIMECDVSLPGCPEELEGLESGALLGRLERAAARVAIVNARKTLAGLLFALGGLAWAGVRRHRTRSIEVAVERHALVVDGTRIPVATLDADAVGDVLDALRASGHVSAETEAVFDAVVQRAEAARVGDVPSEAHRAALERLTRQ